MKQFLKRWLFKCYKLVNALPFNNSVRKGKTKIDNKGKLLHKCKIRASGNNVIVFRKGGVLRNTTIQIRGNNNVIEIGEKTSVNYGDIYIEDDNNRIVIGDRTSLCGKIHLACTEGKEIRIGNDCLFSSEIVLRTGDSHSITDLSGKRLNLAENVAIGDHVWVGHRVLVNKGAVIPENTVVGTGAIVTKPFDESNTVIAGVPAKVIKRDVNWCSERI